LVKACLYQHIIGAGELASAGRVCHQSAPAEAGDSPSEPGVQIQPRVIDTFVTQTPLVEDPRTATDVEDARPIGD
jgi:hypothetical protein